MHLPLFVLVACSYLAINLPSEEDNSHRTGDLIVRVLSLSGEPVEGATVEVEMLNHAFRFGTAVENHPSNPDDPRYDPWTVETALRFQL